MSTILAALPAMHLVCNIVVSEVPPVVQINSATSANQSPSLPAGYIVYPDVKASYKVFDEKVTWDVAKERCARDKADLAVIDSEVKINLVKNQLPLGSAFRHVGFRVKAETSDTWLNVKTGLPVTSLPWAAAEPTGDGRCAMMKPNHEGRLGKYTCDSDAGTYVCELPVPATYKN